MKEFIQDYKSCGKKQAIFYRNSTRPRNFYKMKTVKFCTLGCKVNQYDTQSIRERFIKAGFKELEDSQPANVYVINTCTVTHRADADSLSLIRKTKRENPKAKIIVTGCLAELDEDRIKKQHGVSLIVKNKDKENILATSQTDKGISFFKGHTRAFLKIQDGCNNRCSYCKVPLARGPSRSKALSEIIMEAARLVKSGFKEIVLAGICLGAYGRDLTQKIALVDVIKALENIDGLLRVRLSSIEATDISHELIDKLSYSKKLCRHLHIPIQSGDDAILKKMNRPYNSKDYINLIQRIKMKIPRIAITTDCLVGFPGETEYNFQNTLKLVQEILPLKVHIFPYSPRCGTAAGSLKELSPVIIKDRILRLKDASSNCSLDFKEKFLNKIMDVLIEASAKERGYWEGYTGNYIRTRVKSGFNLKNKLMPLRLRGIFKNIVLADFC
jgi:threonylcarbamoyladenosine tRNA methylthiotransferase MtaB